MNEQNLTIDEAKNLLNQGFGSIYTKDEVMSLLDRIKENSIDIKTILDEVVGDFRYKTRNFDKDDVVDVSSASFSIECENSIVIDDLDINLSNIEEALEEVIAELKDKY